MPFSDRLFNANIYMYIYVCMLFSDRVVRDHSYGGMISYASE